MRSRRWGGGALLALGIGWALAAACAKGSVESFADDDDATGGHTAHAGSGGTGAHAGSGGTGAHAGSGGSGAQGGTAAGGHGGGAPTCGDGIIAGTEQCDDGDTTAGDGCSATCTVESGWSCSGQPSQCHTICGDGIIAGAEQCDDGDTTAGDGCNASCSIESGWTCSGQPSQCTPTGSCNNPGGGPLAAENGVGINEMYCYAAGDSTDIRALKACESHFGVGTCCIITGGYQNEQYGQCGMDGYGGTIHWHWDNHPDGHCDPLYVVGDVVSPGWCGVILGSFLD